MSWKRRLAVQSAFYFCCAIVIVACDLLFGHYSSASVVALVWILADWVWTACTFKEQEERIDRLQTEIRYLIQRLQPTKPEIGIPAPGNETGIMELE